MSFLLPFEVPTRYRKLAWGLFILLALSYIAYVAVAIVLAVRARKNPPVSVEYIVEDVDFPALFICPVVSANFAPQDQVKLGSFLGRCNTDLKARGDDYISGPSINIDLGSVGPLNWNATRAPEQNFTYYTSADCQISTIIDKNEQGISLLCFHFSTDLFKVKERTILEDLDTFDLEMGWSYNSILTGSKSVLGNGSTFERKAFVVASYNKEKPLQNKLAAWTIPTGLKTNLVFQLTRREHLNGSTLLLGSFQSSSFPLAFSDPFPEADYFQTFVALDKRGSLVIKEQNPLNVTVLLSQVFAAWGFASFVFGLVFVKEDVRKYILDHNSRKKAKQTAMKLMKSIKVLQTTESEQTQGFYDKNSQELGASRQWSSSDYPIAPVLAPSLLPPLASGSPSSVLEEGRHVVHSEQRSSYGLHSGQIRLDQRQPPRREGDLYH